MRGSDHAVIAPSMIYAYAALSLGMPLDEIQDYLDWLDATRGVQFKRPTTKPARDGESKPHGVEQQPPS